MGLPRWEVAGNEMGRRIYHMIWDFKDKNWPVLRWEDEFTSSTAQGGGGSFKNRKPIGEVGCCESGMAERSH